MPTTISFRTIKRYNPRSLVVTFSCGHMFAGFTSRQAAIAQHRCKKCEDKANRQPSQYRSEFQRWLHS